MQNDNTSATGGLRYLPSVNMEAMTARHLLQLRNMQDESPATLESVREEHRIEWLRAIMEVRDLNTTMEIVEKLKLVKFAGFKLFGTSALEVYKSRAADLSEGFYIVNGTNLYRYPEAFKVTQRIPIVREDPATPTLDDLGPWKDGYHSGETYLIAKVMANEQDCIRIIFADPDSTTIRMIAGVETTYFNDLDVGALVRISGKCFFVSRPYGSSGSGHMQVPRLYANARNQEVRGMHGYLDSTDAYTKIRQDYINKFLKGNYKDIQVKCFKFCRKSFSYSDTVIACNWPAMKSALSIVLHSYSSDFNSLYYEILKGAQGFSFKVNGTDVRVDKKEASGGAGVLWYVNNYRISAPDLTEVLMHALCFPKSTKVYNDYLSTVSKMSLKFHRAVSKGLPFCMNAAVMELVQPGNTRGIRRPGGMRVDNSGVLEIQLKINKTFGKKTNFDFLGKTRYVNEFDAFKRVAADYSIKGCNRNVVVPTVADGLPHREFVQRLQALDVDLVDDSKFLKDLAVGIIPVGSGGYVMDERGYRRWDDSVVNHQNTVLDTPENAEAVRALQTQFSEAFRSGLDLEQKILERSYELLQQVMQETGAVCVEEDSVFYYKVSGLSGTRYKIKEDNAAVHLDTEGSDHICIVKASNDIDGYDYIASLIMALSQDKFTARNIHTLERHVGGKAA